MASAAASKSRKLYAIEKAAKDLGDEARGAMRTEKTKPILEDLRAWLELADAKVLPKSPMAKAVGYALRQWDALCAFAGDGRLSVDNNAAERALRPFTVGRRNWLFLQRDTRGTAAATAELAS